MSGMRGNPMFAGLFDGGFPFGDEAEASERGGRMGRRRMKRGRRGMPTSNRRSKSGKGERSVNLTVEAPRVNVPETDNTKKGRGR